MAREQFGQAPAKRIDCPIKSGPSDFSRLVMEKLFSQIIEESIWLNT
jgi:hypothetical protein